MMVLLIIHGAIESKKLPDISTGMPAVFANPYASRSQHISSQKIARFSLK